VRIIDDDELNAAEKIQSQLPEEPPPVPFDMDADFPELNAEPTYSVEPAKLRTIALLKNKYRDAKAARTRARELCLATGERIHRFFETGRAWVVHVHAPLPPPEKF
jgi:hypothetical protein